MASVYAVAAVSETLRGILYDARPQPEFSGAQVEVFQPSDYQRAKPIEEGISIMLYRVSVSAQQRGISARLNGARHAPALPIDLQYLLTVWGRTAVKQHRLLGWMLRLLEDKTLIEASLLNHYGRPERSFEDDETVTIAADPLQLSDFANLWDILKPNAQLSVGYIARMVYLESPELVDELGLVQTRAFQMAQVVPGGGR